MDSSLRTAAQQALAWLERETPFTMEEALETEENLRVALRAALAEPVQEPVATLYGTLPIYDTAPPQRKPLTEEEIQAAWDSVDMRHPRGNETRIAFTRAIERAHGIGS